MMFLLVISNIPSLWNLYKAVTDYKRVQYNTIQYNTLFKRRKIKNKIVKVSLERGYSRG